MQFILIMEFCFIDVNDMVVIFQSCFFLFIYLIDANVNHEIWIGGFLNPFITLSFQEDAFSFLGFFILFLGKPNENKFIFNNYSFVSLIIGMFLGNKYNEIFIYFIY